MSLLTKKSDLKLLKYGKDQPKGGNSGQPYQQVDINKVDSGFNRFRMTKFDDGLVRGGVVGAANAAIVDTFRIGKFLTDFPKGPLWLVKQVGLQLANPKLEAKQLPIGRATSGLGFFRNAANLVSNVVNRVTNVIGPTRVYNPLGINTLAQVPLNAFGQHLLRFGALPVRNNDILYFKTAQFNNQGNGSANRLVKLTSILGNSNDIDSYLGGSSSIYGIGTTIIRRRGDFIILNQDVTANKYATNDAKINGIGYRVNGHGDDLEGYNNAFFRVGNFIGLSLSGSSVFAPNSFSLMSVLKPNLGDTNSVDYQTTLQNAILGINNVKNSLGSGSNAIGAYSEASTDPSEIIKGINKTTKTYQSTLQNVILGIDNLEKDYYIGTGSNAIRNYPGVSTDPFEIRTGIDQDTIRYKNSSVKTYTELVERIESNKNRGKIDGKNTNQFNIYGDTKSQRTGNYTVYSPVSNETPTYYNGKKIITLDKTWRKITREDRVGSGLQDQINLTPLFDASPGSIKDTVTIPGVGPKNINDLVKFRIQALNGNNPTLPAKWMIFRAYITQFSDSVDAPWNEVQYAGRGDKFYIYNGFSRKISIGFKVAALSFDEMEPMYQKLNFLMGNLMPDYNSQGLMRGPMVKMTVGNWIDGQDGILNSLSYTVPQDSPWEIGLKVNNGIEPLILPHVLEVSMTFTPIGSQTKDTNKISGKSTNTSHIAQNYNNETQYIK
jgi:hypothetical protein